MADKNDFGHNFDFIADTDTEKYCFRIISAMNSDKRYKGILGLGGGGKIWSSNTFAEVAQYFCRSVRVRGRRNTPNSRHAPERNRGDKCL